MSFEPFVAALARLGKACDARAVSLADAVAELLVHPAVVAYGWDDDYALHMCQDAILNWQDTLFEIELEDDIGEQLLGRVEPLMKRLEDVAREVAILRMVNDAAEQWARGEVDLDGPGRPE